MSRTRSLGADQGRHFDERAATWADRYRTHPSFRSRLAVVGEALDEELAARPHARVLDFGGGPGLFAELAAQRADEAVCIDRSQPMIEWGGAHRDELLDVLAGAGFPHKRRAVRRIVGDTAAIPHGGFDLVLAIAVLEYVEDLPALMGSLAASVRPGGALLATVPNPRSPVRWAQASLGPLVAAARRGPGRVSDQEFAALRPHGDRLPWRSVAAEADLNLDKTTSVPLGQDRLRRHLHPNVLVRLSPNGGRSHLESGATRRPNA